MISIYDNATIDIISASVDSWGTRTESVAYPNLSVRTEPVNKPVIGKDGQELMAQTLIIISDDDTIIGWDDKIKIKTIDGDDVETKDKQYVIKSKFKAPGFVSSHWEVYI